MTGSACDVLINVSFTGSSVSTFDEIENEICITDVKSRFNEKRLKIQYQEEPFDYNEFDYNKRYCVINEILVTEKSYVQNLDRIINFFLIYLKKFSKAKPIIDSATQKKIFRNIRAIYVLHSDFFKELLRQTSGWDKNCRIAHVFRRYIPYFKIYTDYGTGQMECQKILEKLYDHSKSFVEFCEKALANDSVGKLESYLILPIQRLPRYILLIEELLKYTLKNHPEYEELNKAHAEIIECVEAMNSAILDKESKDEIIRIQKLFPGDRILAPSRVLIKKGELKIVGRNKRVFLILFNDMIVAGKKQKKSYNCIWMSDIRSTAVFNDEKVCNQFIIWSLSGTLYFEATTALEKNDWVCSILNLIGHEQRKLKIKSLMWSCKICKRFAHLLPCHSCNGAACKRCLTCNNYVYKCKLCKFNDINNHTPIEVKKSNISKKLELRTSEWLQIYGLEKYTNCLSDIGLRTMSDFFKLALMSENDLKKKLVHLRYLVGLKSRDAQVLKRALDHLIHDLE